MQPPPIFKLPIELTIILDAINFAKEKISQYYENMEKSVEADFRKPIMDEYKEKIEPLNNVEAYLKNRTNSSLLLFQNDSERKFVVDYISSSLRLYRYELKKLHERTNVVGYVDLISKVSQALSNMSKADSNLFQKYAFHSNNIKQKPTKLFISYQQNDVQQACKIQDIITQKSALRKDDVFVAHRDIKLSEEWRKEMIDQLENSTHLLALCTNNYLNSVFGNQEVGYAIAKHIKIAPIFWEGTERNKFGFLEGFQSIPDYANDANLEEIIKKILNKFKIN
jgi:hypothetical protein